MVWSFFSFETLSCKTKWTAGRGGWNSLSFVCAACEIAAEQLEPPALQNKLPTGNLPAGYAVIYVRFQHFTSGMMPEQRKKRIYSVSPIARGFCGTCVGNSSSHANRLCSSSVYLRLQQPFFKQIDRLSQVWGPTVDLSSIRSASRLIRSRCAWASQINSFVCREVDCSLFHIYA